MHHPPVPVPIQSDRLLLPNRITSHKADEEGTNFNGWNASLARNINGWFGVVADVSGHYSSESFAEGFFFANSANLLAYRFGPKFARRGTNYALRPSFGRRCPPSSERNRFSGPVWAACRANDERTRNHGRWRVGRPSYRFLGYSSDSGRV